MSFLNQCNDNIKKEAERFIEEIKIREIRKIKIYEEEFFQTNEKRYLENFKRLTKSGEIENIMNDSYK